MGKNNKLIKRMCASAMLASLSYVLVVLFHFIGVALVPGVSFLTYDPKDILLCISSFALGPAYGTLITVVVSFLEMITISATGIYGFIMNVVASLAFILPAGLIYKNNKTLNGAILSLLIGFVSNILMMTLWNIIITPIYMSIDREVLISNYLNPIVIFNVIKTGLNVAFTLIFYKPVVKALRSLKFMDKKEENSVSQTTLTIIYIGIALLIVLFLAIYLINKA